MVPRAVRDRGAPWWPILPAAAILLILPGGTSLVVLQFSGSATPLGAATVLPMGSGTSVAGTGPCLATLTATVVPGSGAARGNVTVVEPSGCPGGSSLVFLPGLGVSNGLRAPVGHTLLASVTIVGLSGTTSFLRSVHLYLQQMTPGHPIVTSTHAVVRNGGIRVASSSTAALTSRTPYGLGLAIRLTRPAGIATADLSLDLRAVLADGGLARAIVDERIDLRITY